MDDRRRLLLVGYPQVEAETIRSLITAARAAGAAAPLVPPTRLVPALIGGHGSVLLDGRPLHPTAAIGVGIGGHPRTSLAIFRAFEGDGVRTLNEIGAAFRARDRFAMIGLLAASGVPTPSVALAAHDEELVTCARLVGFPLVVAAAEGPPDIDHRTAAGPGDLAAAAATIRRFEWDPVVLLGLPDAGTVWRVLVLAGRVLAAVPHRPPHLGPSAVRDVTCAPPRALRSLALAATTAAGLSWAAIDIALGESGPLVVEVDAWPDLAALESASGRALAGAVVKHLLRPSD